MTRAALLEGALDRARNLFTNDDPHAAADEAVLLRRDDGRNAVEQARAR